MTGAADRVNGREVVREQFVSDPFAICGGVRLRQRFHLGGEIGRTHVFGRRVDQIAYAPRGVEACLDGAQRRRVDGEFRRRARGLAVARELIGTESPAERGTLASERNPIVVETIVARRQFERQRSERIKIVGRGDSGEYALEAAACVGQQAEGAGFGAEIGRRDPLCGTLAERRRQRAQGIFRHCGQRRGVRSALDFDQALHAMSSTVGDDAARPAAG